MNVQISCNAFESNMYICGEWKYTIHQGKGADLGPLKRLPHSAHRDHLRDLILGHSILAPLSSESTEFHAPESVWFRQ